MCVSLDATTVVSGNTYIFQPKVIRIGTATYSHQTVITFEGDFVAFLICSFDRYGITVAAYFAHFRAQAELHAQLFQAALQLFTQGTIHRRDNARCIFHHRYLST